MSKLTRRPFVVMYGADRRARIVHTPWIDDDLAEALLPFAPAQGRRPQIESNIRADYRQIHPVRGQTD